MRLQIEIFKAATIGEIDAAFAGLSQQHCDALFVAGDAFFATRRVQLITLAARDRIPAAYTLSDFVAAGGLMSYGADLAEMTRQVGAYTGKILKGAKPADLPVEQPTRLEPAINLKTAKALGLTFPPSVLIRADQVIQ